MKRNDFESTGLLTKIKVRFPNKEEPQDGWTFNRNPRHWFLTNIPVGGLLVKVPGPSPAFIDGRPEPWSVMEPRENDDGWRPWCGIPEDVANDLFRMDLVDRTQEYQEALRPVGSGHGYDYHFYVNEAIPAVGIRQGDLLVHVPHRDRRPEIRGYSRELGIDDYTALQAAYKARGAGLFTDITPRGTADWNDIRHFLLDRRKWGLRLKNWYSRLLLVRPFDHEVSEPIAASSDDAAIFELLASVGCRMPEAESYTR